MNEGSNIDKVVGFTYSKKDLKYTLSLLKKYSTEKQYPIFDINTCFFF